MYVGPLTQPYISYVVASETYPKKSRLSQGTSSMAITIRKTSLSIVAMAFLGVCQSFISSVPSHFSSTEILAAAVPPSSNAIDASTDLTFKSRRSYLKRSFVATFGPAFFFHKTESVLAADEKLDVILDQIKEARKQLESIPDLIKTEKWDAVRTILIKPPLSKLWTGGQSKLLKNYANAIGDELPDGDEIAAMELREEVISHLRYLDMAVYNNVFNPIASEGSLGASKELIQSYYEDPINEWKALIVAIDKLIKLASF